MDADQHKSLSQKFGVSGFPTIKIFSGSKHTPYQGQRTAEAFIEAVLGAAKERAYANMGKKSGSSSSDKVKMLQLAIMFYDKRALIMLIFVVFNNLD